MARNASSPRRSRPGCHRAGNQAAGGPGLSRWHGFRFCTCWCWRKVNTPRAADLLKAAGKMAFISLLPHELLPVYFKRKRSAVARPAHGDGDELVGSRGHLECGSGAGLACVRTPDLERDARLRIPATGRASTCRLGRSGAGNSRNRRSILSRN